MLNEIVEKEVLLLTSCSLPCTNFHYTQAHHTRALKNLKEHMNNYIRLQPFLVLMIFCFDHHRDSTLSFIAIRMFTRLADVPLSILENSDGIV